MLCITACVAHLYCITFMGINWTAAENNILRQHYATNGMDVLLPLLNRTEKAIYSQAVNLGLKKDATYLATAASGRLQKFSNRGENFRFKKGFKPWNTGMKGLQIGGTATQFKPGQRPPNANPVGTVTVVNDSNGTPYSWISLANKRMLYHRYRWQQEIGPIPHGHVLACKTADTANADPANWQLLTRAENMRRNTIHRYPVEVKQAIRNLTKLKKGIKYGYQKQAD